MSSGSSSALALQRFREAAALHQGGQLERAAALYGAIVREQPGHADALHMLGLIAMQQGRHDEGVRLIGDSLRRNPRQPMAHANLARAHVAGGQLAAAIDCLDRALRLAPEFADGWLLQGNLLAELGRVDEAVATYDRALELQPANAAALTNRGNLRMRQNDPARALADYDQAIARQPAFAEAHNNRCSALLELDRPQDALASADRALALRPDFAAAHNGRGNALRVLRHTRDAIACFEQALALEPHYTDALNNLCGALLRLRRYEETLPLYERLLAIDPARPYVLGNLFQAELYCCAWDQYHERLRQIVQTVGAGRATSRPGTMLSVPCEPTLQLLCATGLVTRKSLKRPPLATAAMLQRRDRIRIAYASSNYGEHPVAQLAAGFLACHDRARFEVHGVALGPTDRGHPAHQKVRATFDAFHEVGELNDIEAAQHLAALKFDLIVDLNGHTLGARPGLLAHRPATLQATFLGYAGTTGAPWFDYLIADAVVVPHDEAGYSECILRLPGCFLPRDDRQLLPTGLARRDEGLPEEGFVFCGFNATYKLNPVMFDIWMRLLQAVPGSVLWLRHPAEPAASNLRREAAMRGVDPERLVYARRVDDHGEHLARHRLADLFLDTQPYNAHTTASDALFVGLPVLTCRGTAFAGRVAESLLRAAGLPELVATDLEHYERLALQLANDPRQLWALRERLGEGRGVQPWFDTRRYTRQLEAGFEAMLARALAGETPADIVVPAL